MYLNLTGRHVKMTTDDVSKPHGLLKATYKKPVRPVHTNGPRLSCGFSAITAETRLRALAGVLTSVVRWSRPKNTYSSYILD